MNAFSVGKGITAILAARCVSLGIIDYDTKVSSIWPEFGTHGKEVLTVRDLLGHRAGLPSFRQQQSPEIIFNWSVITDKLAQETPWWPPGAAHGYHVNTFGFLIGEVLRRATHTSVGALLQKELSAPLSADVFIGLPHRLHNRVATLQWTTEKSLETDTTNLSDEQTMQVHAYSNPPNLSGSGIVNTPGWRSAEMPSTNTHASARGVSRLYTPLATGINNPVSDEVLALACTEVSHDTDRILGRTTRFGHGFQLPIPERGFGPTQRHSATMAPEAPLGLQTPLQKWVLATS